MTTSNPSTLPTEANIQATIARQQAEDRAGKSAAFDPLPGPLKDIFSVPESIQVGKYQVRAFQDADIELLCLIKHPFYQLMVDSMEGKTAKDDAQYLPRGPLAWELYWVMTQDPEAAEKAVSDGSVKAKARAEFGRYQIGAMMALHKAIEEQLRRYTSSFVGYGSKPAEGEKSGPPPSSGVPKTA